MSRLDLDNIVTDTRRGTLINVQNILENEEELKKVAGKCVLLDTTLMLLAEHDNELKSRFAMYVSCDDLRRDLKHVSASNMIRNRRKELERIYG